MQELIELCAKLDLPMVSIVEKGESFNYGLADLKEKCKGFYEGTENHREGLVFRLQKNWYEKYRS